MKMLRLVIVLTLVAAVAVIADDVQSVTGEVVDTHCYLSRGAHGEEHKGCANACLSRDVPAALLTEDGKLYLLLSEKPVSIKEKVAGKAGTKVTAKGKIIERDGLRAIQVTSLE
jgi:hypothetical protein